MNYDFIIIGAGIVGLSTAWQLQKSKEKARILLLEKESSPARHQTGHNSGVIHAGVYYEPGSLKARFCREGASATYVFCRDHGITCRRTGKLIVATSEVESSRLQQLFQRCRENGLEPELLSSARLRELEPAIRGSAAILVRETGIVDYAAICREMLRQFSRRGGHYLPDTEVTGITEHSDSICVHSGADSFSSRKLAVCAGLMADRLARMQNLDDGFRIVPYRGEYYRLRPELDGLIRHLIYPVPDPALPFLGVHLTLMHDGTVTVGPNAVQGWKREGYGHLNFDLRDTLDMMTFPGFWKATARHLHHGLRETRNSLWKKAYLAEVRKYCPQLASADLLPHPAGVRAQAVMRDGTMLHDFLIRQTARSLHVCNAPSPAATSAIPIGRHICSLLTS
ncbi:MAG: L-2-hydroxyglutarate oxidase [Xanthomonadales bacterium]|nr:L-2-hydroxyglutarate oxidase [Gammaproteobacteria bacterium]MBT8053289.1 L-2-hydroxyglutarate oxidase [Gammaproteobacteria bacterium]NND58478.1 L-2-hydroxyglutarate oxidase [Xanthomonadales bacterium]NNK50101.1 L-2-hydroxyglutarate oxidase [Xanthomonadales bacterium]